MKANYKCSNWLLLSSLALMLIQYSCQQEDLLIYEAKKSDVVMSLKEGSASIQNVTLENAGTLSERVTDVTSIKELTIVGPINGTDINCIRSMNNLKVLNLENADIVAGGEKYGIYSWSSGDPQSTENNKITRNLFESSPCEKIVIPKSVTSIDQGGFIASKITSMEIPENVTSMGGHVFTYCPNLRSITFLADLKSIPSDTFQGCESLISVTLPKSLVEIESSAFRGCSKLESISLPEGLESIGSDAFFACPISSVIIPSTVKNIGGGAFNDTKLEYIKVPASVVSVGTYAFESTTMRYVFWDSSMDIISDMFDDRMSPNCIVYLSKDVKVPAKWNNIVYNGVAEKIVLTADEAKPFYCPKKFKAKKIMYTHDFKQITGQGESAGWETIVLPFNVQKVIHEDGRILAPFNSEIKNAKPFWLRALTKKGFENVISLNANTPYIIAMPNNGAYEEQYCVNGKVVFEAEDNINGVDILETPNEIKSEGPSFLLTGTYNAILSNSTIYLINKNDNSNGFKAGSVFIRGLRDVDPFECFVSPNGLSTKSIISINEVVRTKTFNSLLRNGKKLKPSILDL